jgi:hypothetical protein
VNGNADAGSVSNNVNPQNSQQLHDSHNNNNNNNHHSIPSPLPMPPKKLNSVYITKLFDPTNSPTVNPKEYQALKYLTDVRGLTKSVLLKYGVGCAHYNFPSTIQQQGSSSNSHCNNNNTNSITEENNNNNSNKSKIGYVSSMCVTFPWLMRASEVAELEELRGSTFVWRKDSDIDLAVAADSAAAATSTSTRASTTESGATTKRMTKKEGKHTPEMTPLDTGTDATTPIHSPKGWQSAGSTQGTHPWASEPLLFSALHRRYGTCTRVHRVHVHTRECSWQRCALSVGSFFRSAHFF